MNIYEVSEVSLGTEWRCYKWKKYLNCRCIQPLGSSLEVKTGRRLPLWYRVYALDRLCNE